MIARTLTSAALAAALGLSACPADASGPSGIVANGTRLNGITLQLCHRTRGQIHELERSRLATLPQWLIPDEKESR